MATETFDKNIYIDEKAAEIMVRELEKPRKPYISDRSIEEIVKEGDEWLNEFRLRKSQQKKNTNF